MSRGALWTTCRVESIAAIEAAYLAWRDKPACDGRLTLFKVTVRRLHRAVVQELYEMNELHVRLDVRAARSDIIGFERLCRHHFAKLLVEPFLNGHRE